METKLVRIAEISATSKHPIFTSVYHLINEDMLKQCHKELDGNKAVGIDKVTKDEYGKNLDRNIKELVQRLKNKSFKPLPSLRVYIPKGNGKKRPLGIASYEDKIVQMAVKKILGAIYEPRFLNCMYGFRPNRGCHEAIKEVYQRISYGKISYIVDADIKGFFDHIDHDWMMKFLEWNIQDKNLLWLIRKYLKAGIMEQGKFEPTEEGSAQGSAMSPMLANIYMHHVLTLWFKLVVQREMQGECFLVNFADDFVAGFQYKSEAERYYKELKERMEKFGLELESSKSRLIEFGRFAEQNRRARGECKPETFDFLGFTFYCSKTRKGGFVPKVQTSRKKFEQKVRAYKNWIYDNRNRPMREIIKELNVKLIGHYRYYGVTWNFRKITTFLHRVQQFLFKAMNRRGCRRAYTWNGFVEMLKYYPLAKPKTAKSILISCGARLAPFDIKELRDLTSYDELELDMLGDEKTSLFVIISDTNDTFNFIVSIMYTQLFNLLCDRADDVYNGRLPIHVRCLLDEFANIGQIPKFEKLIATIRSREISASIILQSKSQLKAIYKDNADTIEG